MKTLMELLKEKIDNDNVLKCASLDEIGPYNWFADIYFFYHDKKWYEVRKETLTVRIEHEDQCGFDEEDEIECEWKICDDFDFDLFEEAFGRKIDEIEEKYISEHRDDQLEKLGL